jgi:hypothetical protein
LFDRTCHVQSFVKKLVPKIHALSLRNNGFHEGLDGHVVGVILISTQCRFIFENRIQDDITGAIEAIGLEAYLKKFNAWHQA